MEAFLHAVINLGPTAQIVLIGGIIWLMTLVALSRRIEENIACFFYDVFHGKRRPRRVKQRRKSAKTSARQSEKERPAV